MGIHALDSRSVKVLDSRFTHTGRNFVQFVDVRGSGNTISGNLGENSLGGSTAEDLISIYNSSNVDVNGNRLRNGGPSASGSGILVGDVGGSNITVRNNHLVNPGQVGIGVASGTDITIADNIVYSDAHSWSNVGIYVWNQYPSPCGEVTVVGNKVRWYGADGLENPRWDGGNCGLISGWDNNDWHAALTSSEE